MQEIADIIEKAERMINGTTITNQHVTRRWLKLAIRRLYQLNENGNHQWIDETCKELESSSLSKITHDQ